MTKRSSIIIYLAALMLLATWAFLPSSWAMHRPYVEGEEFSYATIIILSPIVPNILLWGSVTVAVCLLILGLRENKWPDLKFPIVAFLISIVVFPCAGASHVFCNLLSWTSYGRVADSSGQSYVFCDQSFLQGQTMAIGKLEYENLFATKIKVFGINNGDSPRSWASVVRPANAQDTYGQLYLTDQKMLVGVRYDNHCFLAYDLASNTFYGHEDIERVSPFICLNADDELHAADIEAIRKRITESKPILPGYPHRDALESARKHPNPRVKDVAESLLLQIGKQRPPTPPAP